MELAPEAKGPRSGTWPEISEREPGTQSQSDPEPETEPEGPESGLTTEGPERQPEPTSEPEQESHPEPELGVEIKLAPE